MAGFKETRQRVRNHIEQYVVTMEPATVAKAEQLGYPELLIADEVLTWRVTDARIQLRKMEERHEVVLKALAKMGHEGAEQRLNS